MITPVFAQTPTGLQPLPQNYYIVTSPPAGVQVQSNPLGIDLGEIISGLTGGGLAGLYAKFRGDKQQKTTQEIAQNQVKITDAALQTNQQVFENMTDKGESINDKPAIKVTELQKTKDKAVETAAKA